MQRLVGGDAVFSLAFSEVDHRVEDQLDRSAGKRTGDQPDAAGVNHAVRAQGDHPVARTCGVFPDLLPGQIVSLEREIRQGVDDRAELVGFDRRPLRWDTNDALAVDVAAKHSNGGPLSTILHLKITNEGVVTITKK